MKTSWNRVTQRSCGNDWGTTLVEVLISVFILASTVVGIIALFAKCNVFAAELRQGSIVNSALNQRMEEIRAMEYSEITGLATTFTTPGFDDLINPAGEATVDDPFSDSDICRVTLTIEWTTPQGRAMSKSLAAYFTDSGINQQ